MKTKFFVMNEGRLVFGGSQAELKASEDPYVRKFVEMNRKLMAQQTKAKWAQLRVGVMAIVGARHSRVSHLSAVRLARVFSEQVRRFHLSADSAAIAQGADVRLERDPRRQGA